MSDYNPKKSVLDRMCDYDPITFKDNDEDGQTLFCKDIDEKDTDDDDDDLKEFFIYSKAWRQAVQEWTARPKVEVFEDCPTNIDFTAHETAFGLVALADEQVGIKRGAVLVHYGSGHAGATVSARWISDTRALLSRNKVPAWVTAAEFADFGAFKNKAVKLVSELRGVKKRYDEKAAKDEEDCADRCISVIDGIGGDKLTPSETFALLSAIEGCTDRAEYDLIITTPCATPADFIAKFAGGAVANGIVTRLNERGRFIAFKADRVGACPWITEDYEVVEPYGLPEKPC